MSIEKNRQSLEDRVQEELADSLDEELELELGDDLMARLPDHLTTFPGRKSSTAGYISPNCCACSASSSSCRTGW